MRYKMSHSFHSEKGRKTLFQLSTFFWSIHPIPRLRNGILESTWKYWTCMAGSPAQPLSDHADSGIPSVPGPGLRYAESSTGNMQDSCRSGYYTSTLYVSSMIAVRGPWSTILCMWSLEYYSLYVVLGLQVRALFSLAFWRQLIPSFNYH